MTGRLRLLAVGGDPGPAARALEAATGCPVEVLGAVQGSGVLLALGLDLALDAVAWWAEDPDGCLDDLRAFARLRPGVAVLLLIRDPASVGRAELLCEAARERGELRAVAVAAPEPAGLEVAAVRLAAQQGWPLLPADGAGLPRRRGVVRTATPSEGILVATFGPKGGCGRTTVALNLVALAAHRLPRACLLVDLDVEKPDVAALLDLGDGPDLVDLLPRLTGGEEELAATPCRRGGFDVVPGPARPELAELVRPEHVERLLRAARRGYRLVVVDTSGRLADELAYLALRAADRVLAVTSPDPAGLRQTAAALALLARADGELAERVRVVLNGAGAGGGAGRGRVEAALGVPPAAVVPEDRAATLAAAAAGVPLAAEDPEHPIAAALAPLLRDLGVVDRPAQGPRRGHGEGLLRQLWRELRGRWGAWVAG